LLVRDAHVVVAADATLYYRDDLRKRLSERRVRVAGQTPSHLVAAAYRAWGERCAEHLEGDFAFVLWDQRLKQLVAARDIAGSRPLYFSAAENGVAFASAAHALLDNAGSDSSLDLAVIAESLAGYVRPGGATCYRGVRRLDAGTTATFSSTRGLRIVETWKLIGAPDLRSSAHDDADELTDLVSRAVAERMNARQRITVWLGRGRGRGSDFGAASVFGSAMARAREQDRGAGVIALATWEGQESGDSHIEWSDRSSAGNSGSVHWLSMPNAESSGADFRIVGHDGLPIAGRAAHVHWMARTAVQAGSRIALYGAGSGLLATSSWTHLSDMLITGRWFGLLREWRAALRGGVSSFDFIKSALTPLVPTSMVRASMLLGAAIPADDLRLRVPEWVDAAFARRHSLSRYVRMRARRRRGERLALSDEGWRVCAASACNANAGLAELALTAGVELRAPLRDQRIVAFALSRLRAQSVDARTLLLRRVRAQLTGVAHGDAAQSRAIKPHALDTSRLLHDCLTHNGDPATLVALGVVDVRAFRAACDRYRHTRDEGLAQRLLLTLETERWLRRREAREERQPDSGGLLPALAPAV
jgi:hypothetical protein